MITKKKKARNILFGISNFFLLTFRISERAMLTLLLFIQHLIRNIIYSIIGAQHKVIDILLSIFPKSLYCMRKLTNTKQDLLEYVVCPKCNCLYLRTDCIIKLLNGEVPSRRCDYIEFQNHRYQSRRQKCGTLLMKCIHTGNNNTMKYAPRKTFFYHSVILSSLKTLVLRKEFLRKCELWRLCVTPRNVMTDYI